MTPTRLRPSLGFFFALGFREIRPRTRQIDAWRDKMVGSTALCPIEKTRQIDAWR